ncbi:hypothetical protein BDR07DRAFT_1372037 [Suillus spraguei]|nr:hypothetical protein BDR07DRAFT_1372037 [Suillus spraguei]
METKSYLPPSRGANATPGSPSGHDDKLGLGQPSDANNRPSIVIQQNYIAEGVTISIHSSNSYGSTVTKLEHVAAQPAEPTPLQRSLMRQLAPVEYSREGVVFNGNTFGDYVVINIASPHSTGAVKQIALPSPGRTRNRTRNRTKSRTKSF